MPKICAPHADVNLRNRIAYRSRYRAFACTLTSIIIHVCSFGVKQVAFCEHSYDCRHDVLESSNLLRNRSYLLRILARVDSFHGIHQLFGRGFLCSSVSLSSDAVLVLRGKNRREMQQDVRGCSRESVRE